MSESEVIFRRVEKDQGILLQDPENSVNFRKLSYDELVSLAFAKQGKEKKYSLSDKGYEGKAVAQLSRAMLTGQWSNGKKIDRTVIVGKLISLLSVISKSGGTLSNKAKSILKKVVLEATMDANDRSKIYSFLSGMEDAEIK